MLGLAAAYGHGPVQAHDLARKHGLPGTYLEQILSSLGKAGLITSTRGASGGHALVRPPVSITLAEVLTALEGPFCIVECKPDTLGCRTNPEQCALRDLWGGADLLLDSYFSSLSLATLLERVRAKAIAGADDYVI
jgi:Rrf2 family protein